MSRRQTSFGHITETGFFKLEFQSNIGIALRDIKGVKQAVDSTLIAASSLLGILRTMNLGEDTNEIIGNIHQLILMINMLKTALYSLYAAAAPLSPFAAAVAGVGLIVGAVSGATMVGELADSLRGNQG